jgi:ribA/ribD-fused uncharacterized protein
MVWYDGRQYGTVEHAYQAAKTLDLSARAYIRVAASPAIAKKLGKKAKIREDWEEVKVEIMRRLLRQKFLHHPYSTRLKETGDELIVEVNWWGDRFWGVCEGDGQNYLGRLIMEIRSELLRPTS